jgi:hypothetical protein
MVGGCGLELLTSCVSRTYSNQRYSSVPLIYTGPETLTPLYGDLMAKYRLSIKGATGEVIAGAATWRLWSIVPSGKDQE